MVMNVAMLRGVNVGARNKIKMSDLAALFEGLGHTNITTYIQSGNVVFDSRSKGAAAIGRGIEARISQELGLDVKVLLRTRDELAAVIRSNPFVRSGADVSKLHVTFLAEKPYPALVRAIAGADFSPDEFRVAGREVYVHCPAGYGNTKINNAYFEKRLQAVGTTRNWNSVNKLLELASA